jgi:RNA polymerase sigma-70 factor (ECF subfamily)
LFAAHEPALRAFTRSLVPTRGDMREVMQAVALVLWRKFPEARTPDDFRRFAYGALRMQVLAWRRDRARDRHLFSRRPCG